jgi:hypothetical protein
VTSEFQTVKPGTVRSTRGFTVGGIYGALVYEDPSGRLRIGTELYVKPNRLVVYRDGPDLKNATRARQDEVLSNVKRALEYMGHTVEIQAPELFPDDFKKVGTNKVSSRNEFTVEVTPSEVLYDDATGHVSIKAEQTGFPERIVLYLGSLPADSRTTAIVSNLRSALGFLGFRIEIRPNE